MLSQEKVTTIATAAIEAGIKPGSLGDLMLAAEAANLKPGQLQEWLRQQRADHPTWFAEEAKPETPPPPTTPAPPITEPNPFSHEHWNLTKQGQLYKSDPKKAEELANLAGTTVGGLKPTKAPLAPTTPSRDPAGRFLPSGEPNPFSAEHWNLTRQGELLKKHGMEKAEQMAKAAGTTIGAPRPQLAQERPLMIWRRRPLQPPRPQAQKPE